MSSNTEQDLQKVKDYIEISNLQGRYNHYVLGHHFDKILEMFADRPDITGEMDISGVFTGPEGVKELFLNILGKLYNYPGNLALHQLTTPVIEVSQDGQSAHGMWFSSGSNTHKHSETGELIPIWQIGKYDNRFVKENGEWKYLHFYWTAIVRTPFDQGWVKMPVIGNIKGGDTFGEVTPGKIPPYDPTRDYPGVPLPPVPEL